MGGWRMLEVKGVTIKFGGLTAVDHVDMMVRDHKITGLNRTEWGRKDYFFLMYQRCLHAQ